MQDLKGQGHYAKQWLNGVYFQAKFERNAPIIVLEQIANMHGCARWRCLHVVWSPIQLQSRLATFKIVYESKVVECTEKFRTS